MACYTTWKVEGTGKRKLRYWCLAHTGWPFYDWHTFPMGGHMGREKTEARLTKHVFWPGMYKMIEKYC